METLPSDDVTVAFGGPPSRAFLPSRADLGVIYTV